MAINNQIRDEKLQYDIHRKAAEILEKKQNQLRINLLISQKLKLYLVILLTKEKI